VERYVSTPTRIDGLREVVTVAADAFHTLALTRDETVWSVGIGGPWLDEYEAGGFPDPALRRVPGVAGATSIAAGGYVDFAVQGSP
jgi:hypothetical protein